MSSYKLVDAPYSGSIWSEFESVNLNTLIRTMSSLKSTMCPQDVIPPRFLRQIIDTVGPDLLSVINKCLQTGTVPHDFKLATVRPHLKKTNLDSTLLSNFRPISNLPFLSKILEKVVLNQLQSHLSYNSIYEKFQSGFKSCHSTESALLRVLNDVMLTTDSGQFTALVLLDLSSAFDLVNHNVLISRLETCVGLRGIVLQWFRSYLSDRRFVVNIGHHSSSEIQLRSGVPQGSILGPALFSLYLLPLGSIFSKYGVSFHLYADDTQIYIPLKRGNKNAFKPILDCLEELKLWLATNFLSLNESKTEFIVFGPTDQCVYDFKSTSLSPYSTSCVRNLGVLFDSNLKFDKQISTVVKSCFYHIRLLSKVKPFLSLKKLEIAMHAFVTSRLDYCNSLYVGVSQSCVSRLQLVQNAAARLLTGKCKYENITPVLISLHWLPVKYRIDYKILMFVFKSLHSLAPQYLTDLLQPYIPSRSLRSTNFNLLQVPRTRLKTRGDRAFSVVGPKLWNDLPFHIRTAPTLSVFKSTLKTYLFSLAFNIS